MVHQILVLKLAIIFSPVAQTIPWLDADEWSVLACWVPDSYGWSLELEGYMRFALLVENAHLLNLTLVEDNSIFCESLLVYFPDTLVGFYGFLSLTVDASAYVTIETNRSLVVEFQGSLHFFALLAARNHECWVTANLEEDFLVVGILYVPDDMNLVALQAVRDGKVEVVRIVLLSLFVVDEREGEAVGSCLLYTSPSPRDCS